MFAQYRQNRTPFRNSIHFIHISLRYKTALSAKTVKRCSARQILAGQHDVNKQLIGQLTPHPCKSTVFARVEIGLAKRTLNFLTGC